LTFIPLPTRNSFSNSLLKNISLASLIASTLFMVSLINCSSSILVESKVVMKPDSVSISNLTSMPCFSLTLLATSSPQRARALSLLVRSGPTSICTSPFLYAVMKMSRRYSLTAIVHFSPSQGSATQPPAACARTS